MNRYVTMLGTTAYLLDSNAEMPVLEPPNLRPAPRAYSRPWRSASTASPSATSSSNSYRLANTFDSTFASAFPTTVVVPPRAGGSAGPTLTAGITPHNSEVPLPAPAFTARVGPVAQEQPLAMPAEALSSPAGISDKQSPPNPIPVQSPPNPIPVQSPPNPIPVQSPPNLIPVQSPPNLIPVQSPPNLIPVQSPPNPIPVQSPPNPIPVQSPPNPIPVQSPPNLIPVQSPPNSMPVQSPTALPLAQPLPGPPLAVPVPPLIHVPSPSPVSILGSDPHRLPTTCSLDHSEMAGNGYVYCPKCGSRVHFDSPVLFLPHECPASHERESMLPGDLYCIICGAMLVQCDRRDGTKSSLHCPTAETASHQSQLLALEEPINSAVNAVAQRSEVPRAAPLQCEGSSNSPEARETAVGLSEASLPCKQNGAGASIDLPNSMCYTASVPGVTCGLPQCALCVQKTSKTIGYPLTTLKKTIPSQHVNYEQLESKAKVVVIHNHYYSV